MSATCSWVACGPASTCAASPGIIFMVRKTTIDTPSKTGTVASSRSMLKRSISGAERHRSERKHIGVWVHKPFDFPAPGPGRFLVDGEDPRRVVHGALLDLVVDLPALRVVGRGERFP